MATCIFIPAIFKLQYSDIMKRTLFYLLIVFIVSCSHKQGPLVKVINYKGWEQSVALKNAKVKVVVVPQIGRIMNLSFIDDENILFEDEKLIGKKLADFYAEGEEIVPKGFGGDRIWACSQDLFAEIYGSRFVADRWIDGGEWSYELLKNGVKIESPVSEKLGVKVTREIILDEQEAKITINQKMEKVQLAENTALEPVPLTIWNLTQLKATSQGLIQLNDNSLFENGIFIPEWPDAINYAQHNYFREDKVGVLLPPDSVQSQKIGADSPGWVAGIVGNTLLVEEFIMEQGQKYPDGGTSTTIYSSASMTELECLSPEIKLNIGESIKHSMTWQLYKIPKEITGLEAQREKALEMIFEKS